MKRPGFTLIELLVVIAIIAVLMGILMPALRRVKMQAQRAVCGTRLKEIGTSLNIYGQAFDDRLPPLRENGDTQDQGHWTRFFRTNNGEWWNYAFLWNAKIVKDPRIFYCPSPEVRFKYKDYSEPEFPADSPIEGNPGTRVSYMYNPIFVSTENRERKYTRLSELQATGTVLSMDSFLDGSVPHVGGWNVLFGDFSVRQVLDPEILELVEDYQSGIMAADYAHFEQILNIVLGKSQLLPDP